MTGAIFSDNQQVKLRLSSKRRRNDLGALVPVGPPDGIEIIVPCQRCGMDNKVKMPTNEVYTLLSGGQVLGMKWDGMGWRGSLECMRLNCTSKGDRTQVVYRVTRRDLEQFVDALGISPGRPVQPQQGAAQGMGATGGGQAQQAYKMAQQANQRTAALQQQMAQLIALMQQGRR